VIYDPTEPRQGDDIDIESWGHEFGYDDDADEPGIFYQYAYDALPDDDEDEIEDHEISAGNWCECGLPRAACHRHNQDA
jgi:hypothetical protein